MQEAGPETSRKSLKNRMLDEKTEEKGHSQMQKSGALAIYELLSTLSSWGDVFENILVLSNQYFTRA